MHKGLTYKIRKWGEEGGKGGLTGSVGSLLLVTSSTDCSYTSSWLQVEGEGGMYDSRAPRMKAVYV